MSIIPQHRCAYYAGEWHKASGSQEVEVTSPGTGELITTINNATREDVDAAVNAAAVAFESWREVHPKDRADLLRQIANVIRGHVDDIAELESLDCGSPLSAGARDAKKAATLLDYFAGLVTEIKGDTVPLGADRLNMSVREPLGVVARIYPFNHPFMFCVKVASALAAGNTVVAKPPEQAPLSSFRFAELINDILSPGVFNLLPGGGDVGAALANHSKVAKVSLTGSVGAGRAVLHSAADSIKRVTLELGGKNALIAFADADPNAVADALFRGMNFSRCGQSCGSTSRAMIHDSIYQQVLDKVVARCAAMVPGIPTQPETKMGALISAEHMQSVLAYIESGIADGATLLCGGERPQDPALAGGNYLLPTVFGDVTQTMRIAREEIFGPVLSFMKWTDEKQMIKWVNDVEYGLTCSIWSNDISSALGTAKKVDVGYVWINESTGHFIGTPFGGVKQSGLGREGCLGELIENTREKNIHIRLEGSGPL